MSADRQATLLVGPLRVPSRLRAGPLRSKGEQFYCEEKSGKGARNRFERKEGELEQETDESFLSSGLLA